VAAAAHIILLVWWRRIITRVGDQPAHVITFLEDVDDMGFTRAVAGFATLRCKGRAQVHLLAVLVVVNLYYMCGMAVTTGLAVEIVRTTCGCGLRLFPYSSFRLQAAGRQAHK